MQLFSAPRTRSDLDHLVPKPQRVNDAGALTLGHLNGCIALGTHFCSGLQGGLTNFAVTGYQCVAVWTLIGARCEFETTERAVKEQGCMAVGAYIVVFIDLLATGRTKRGAALTAESIFEEEWRPTIWAFAAEFWWQDQVDFL